MKQNVQILGNNKGQVLELFKNILPIRYYYLLFDIQKFRELVEGTKCVMTKEKLNKQTTGQSSTPYKSLKAHPSAKDKIVKFDEYKLLNNQIDRLAEVMDIINNRPKGRQNKQKRPYKPYIQRGRGHRDYPSYDRDYDRGRGNYRQRSYD